MDMIFVCIRNRLTYGLDVIRMMIRSFHKSLTVGERALSPCPRKGCGEVGLRV
jgi:hypothetical protein